MADFISSGGFHWEYETYGNGGELLLAFHGFGNHCTDFKIFEASLGKRYRIVSFNLPFHGNSTIDDNTHSRTLPLGDLKTFIEKVLATLGAQRFSLMGYSLGGKIALQLIELFPEQIDEVFLFAPDGLRLNLSNAFVTRSWLGKKIYQRIIQDPSRLFALAGFLQKMQLLNRKMFDFIKESLSTREKRERVWNVWLCFRDVNPSIKKLQHLVNEKGIRLHLFFGEYDRIIPPSIGKKFVKGIHRQNTLHVVETGHNLIREKINASIKEVL